MIGRDMNLSRARQCGSLLSIGISTALQRRSKYSMVNTATEKTLKASNARW
jgi:hypothetical protein